VDNPNGRIVAQMKVEQIKQKGQRGKRMRFMDTLVWAVKVASDGTIVSGDSTGSLKIWESRFWSLTQSFQVHKADILCLSIDSVRFCYDGADSRMSKQYSPAEWIEE
jgi:U3 small nucleolar RNA-associated protein 4